jgi:hypothetical protein
MAKLSRNVFIEKHKNSTLVGFDFADFRLRKKLAATKKAPAKQPKAQFKLARVTEPSTGKILPTPNQIIAALAKTVLKSDYFIESGVAGTVQAVHIADEAEAKALADKFPHAPPKRGDGKPATLIFSPVVDSSRAEKLARKLKLF